MMLYQRFDLDLESMTKDDEHKAKLTPDAGRTLRTELTERGYDVLELNTSVGGVPGSMLVGGDVPGTNRKGDFDEITERLGLIFRPEAYYTRREAKE